MRVQLEEEEIWGMLSVVVHEALAESDLSDADRAALRRWRAEEMRPGRPALKALQEKLNADLERVSRAKERSAIQKHDWV